jgi:biotin carboxyl carrier protein
MERRSRRQAALIVQRLNLDGNRKRVKSNSIERRGVREPHQQQPKRRKGRSVKLKVEIASPSSLRPKKPRQIELTRTGQRCECRIDSRLIEADIFEISKGIYSILIGGRSLEVHVEAHGQNLQITSSGREFVASVIDPRRYRKGNSAILAEGRQQVTAPMPGKVIRVLVKAGDKVAAGQGIVVVEAMKMQNEVKSPKAGSIEKLLVKEGQPVNSGDALAVVV